MIAEEWPAIDGHSANEPCDDCIFTIFDGYPVVSYVQTTHLAIMQVSSISNSPSHSMPLEDGPKTTRTGENCRSSSKTLTKKYQKYSRDSHDANDSCLSNVYRIHPHPSHRPKHLVNVVYNIYNLDMFPTCSQRPSEAAANLLQDCVGGVDVSPPQISSLVGGDQPLWKIMEWVTVGWWHSQYDGKNISKCSKPPTTVTKGYKGWLIAVWQRTDKKTCTPDFHTP